MRTELSVRANESLENRNFSGKLRIGFTAVLCALMVAQASPGQGAPEGAALQPAQAVPAHGFDCGYQSPEEVLAAIRAAVEAGEIADPALRPLPQVRPRRLDPLQQDAGAMPRGVPVVTPGDIFPFEDSSSLLLTNFTNGQLFNLMAQATNALLAEHGDEFDFIGFFLNFNPNHTIGAAFYLGLENDTTGIGQGFFNNRPGLGVASNNLQGWVMMWNQASWGPNDTTMLVLGQEVEHRWAMFLNNLLDGRQLQGDNSGCGRNAHWNWKVDGQGSGMEIREWLGANPATLGGVCAPGGFFFICFNSDIGFSPNGLGGVFSYTDLYLMGYVSPAEMDAGNSELRYMDGSCTSPYNGTISTFDSSDIIAANGVRSPNSDNSQKDFRTAWIMFHLPDAPPTGPQLNNVTNILNRWTETWEWSTLGRGKMDNTLGRAFAINFPDGTPSLLPAAQPTAFAVQTENLSGQPDTASGLLHFSVNGGASQSAPLSFLGGDDFEATLPPMDCAAIVTFYVSIDAVGGGTVFAPAGAPNNTFHALVAQHVELDDDFETDMGWTVTGDATEGHWERGVPIGGGLRGDPPTDFDGSGQCWLTENAPGNTDVDFGSTLLTSPVFDLSDLPDPYVSYARWYSNTQGANPQTDIFEVEVSDDGGATWVNLEIVGPTVNDPNPEVNGGWFLKVYRIGDFVDVTDQFRIRFIASDLGPQAIVEAAVDTLRIINCCPGADGDMNGDFLTNGDDIQRFVDVLVSGVGTPQEICAGDFTDSGDIGLSDIPGFVTALTSQ